MSFKLPSLLPDDKKAL